MNDRVGETNVNNKGLKMVIINYRNNADIDIQFDDGTIVYNKQYYSFKNGKIKNPNYRLGETNINYQGMKMTIIGYRSSNDIDIQFDDGTIVYNNNYGNFKNGRIKNKNYLIGETNINYQGMKMTIIGCRKCVDIDVQFEDGYIINNVQYGHFKNGQIKNPYIPTVYEVGYIGNEIIKDENGKYLKSYTIWHGIMQRCCDLKFKEKHPTYKECDICEEWKYYGNFKRWYDKNYYEIEGERVHLDKDILIKGNKIYSPYTCIFVPNRINSLFIKSDNTRGEYPIGVCKIDNKYMASCSMKDYNKTIGRFNTEDEAFLSYKTFKEDYIKQIADEYKDKIPKKLYDAMYKWEVEVDD